MSYSAQNTQLAFGLVISRIIDFVVYDFKLTIENIHQSVHFCIGGHSKNL